MPSFSFDSHYLVILVGVIGTTIAPWMQFYIQSAVVEKGITVKDYAYTKYDVIVGSIMVNLVAVFIVISCAATLHVHGISVDSAKEAALSLGPPGRVLGLHPVRHRPVERLALFGLDPAVVHGVFHL